MFDRCALWHTGTRLLRILLLCSSAAVATAADVGDGAQTLPTPEEVQRQIEVLGDVGTDDPQKARLLEIYQRNAQDLGAIAENRDSSARFLRLYQEAPEKIERHTRELGELQRQARSASELAKGVAVERLEKLLRDTRTRLTELRAEEASLQVTVGNLQSRIETARQELNELTGGAAAQDKPPAAVAGETPAISRARQEQWLIGRELRASRIARLGTEVQTIPDRLAATQARFKLVTAQREQEERFLAGLLGMDSLKRIGDAEQLREHVRQSLAGSASPLPELSALREEITQLADEYVQVVGRSESVGADVAAAGARATEIANAYESIRQQLEIAALSDALGPVLMEQYRKLGSYDQPGSKLDAVASMLSGTRLREFQVTRLLATEVQSREAVYRAVESRTGLGPAERAATLAEADRLLSDRSRLLDALNRTYAHFTGQIVDLEQAYRQQSDAAAGFGRLVDRNLIWMKSHPGLGLADLLAWPRASLGSLLAQDWAGLGAALRQQVLAHPLSAGFALLVVLALTRYRSPLLNRLQALSLRRVGWRDYRYRMGGEALGIHLLLALPVPLLLACAGWLLARVEVPGGAAQALAGACYQTAGLGYLYLLVLGTMAHEGFARAHLRWKTARVQSVRRLLRAGLWVMLPLAFFGATMRLLGVDPADQSYRISGLLVTVAYFAFLVAIVRAARGMFDSAFYSRGHPLLSRLGSLLLLAIVLAQPLVFLLDIQGYHFTARELQLRAFLSTVVLLFSKMLLDAGLLGLTIAAQRSLAATQPPAAAQEAQDNDAPAGDGGPPPKVVDGFDEIDLEKMSAGAIALLQVFVAGAAVLLLVFVWRQFFTALSILDSVGLWTYVQSVDGADTVATVSLFDAGAALLVLALGFVFASGLPALVGVLFYNLITEKGVLYAIQTLIRYTVGVLGVMVSLHMLGFGWSKLQWMAAGLSVGLGFGLQEIFANFVSGLIMLFERPVRIGDVITLGEHSGKIERIRMRATTITDFDNREVIVPNKMFVTERLINWTLSNSVVRLSFDVGVSYDSDPREVRETLLSIIESDPRVLKDPAPNVVFREFGPNSLNMRCFAHVEDVSLRFQVQSELHMRITEVFREKGIEIAYPQMDLHLRSVDPQARPS
ncbi:MAG: Mechanosensitive channel MscK [Pseudomonadales bacterium]|nr:Mechanosensitive channel MscK [Pseudomonadales bacterium]